MRSVPAAPAVPGRLAEGRGASTPATGMGAPLEPRRGLWENSGAMDDRRVGSGRGGGLARYRLRATLGARWRGYLTIALLTGLLGGLALGALAAARRTASSFDVLWASTNPGDLNGIAGVLNPLLGSSSGYDPARMAAIRRLPDVATVESAAGLDILPLDARGLPLNAPNFYTPAAGNGLGSVDGAYFDVDRVLVAQGRMANPRRADELMLSAQGASALGVRLGQRLNIGVYTNAQTVLPGFGTAAVAPYRVMRLKLVGIMVVATTLVQDDVDSQTGSTTNNLFTPAFTDKFLACCVNYSEMGIRVRGGAAHEAKVARQVAAMLPGFPPLTDASATTVDKADRALKPEAIALAGFGGIVVLATLLIVAQVLGRQVRLGRDERAVLRALGASRGATLVDAVAGVVGATAVGAALAVGVALALSPLAPLGPVRPVYPRPGLSFDPLVLGLGALLLFVLLTLAAAVTGLSGSPERVLRRRAQPARSTSRATETAARVGLPVPIVTGLRLALEPRGGDDAVPARSAILGTVLALIVVVSTVTFGSSLTFLVNTPHLYGWNWDEALVSGGDIPQQQVAQLLARDRHVAQWSGAYTADLAVDGTVVPVLGQRAGAVVAPPVLSGHSLRARDQIVLGPVTLAALHKKVGDTVTVAGALGTGSRLTVVGTAALPVLGGNGGQHLEMGTGAVLDSSYLPAVDTNPFNDPLPGPNVVFVRFARGAPPAQARRSLEIIAKKTSNTANFGTTAVAVLRPAEIVNYRTLGGIPVFLGSALAAGAVGGLTLTLLASVRRRRRDLALLKTLGFTRRQFAATVACQAAVAAVIGAVVGIPLGAALGRWLWDLFAQDIHAVPAPTVPLQWVAVIAAGAVVLAYAVSVLPGRMAARTSTAAMLSPE